MSESLSEFPHRVAIGHLRRFPPGDHVDINGLHQGAVLSEKLSQIPFYAVSDDCRPDFFARRYTKPGAQQAVSAPHN